VKTQRPQKSGKRINLFLPPELAERLAEIRKEISLDDTNTLRYLVAVYDLKKADSKQK
jgi:hypothetical protein